MLVTDPQNDFLSEQGRHLATGGRQRQGEPDRGEHRAAIPSRGGARVRGLHLAPVLLPHRSFVEVCRDPREYYARDQHVWAFTLDREVVDP